MPSESHAPSSRETDEPVDDQIRSLWRGTALLDDDLAIVVEDDPEELGAPDVDAGASAHVLVAVLHVPTHGADTIRVAQPDTLDVVHRLDRGACSEPPTQRDLVVTPAAGDHGRLDGGAGGDGLVGVGDDDRDPVRSAQRCR